MCAARQASAQRTSGPRAGSSGRARASSGRPAASPPAWPRQAAPSRSPDQATCLASKGQTVKALQVTAGRRHADTKLERATLWPMADDVARQAFGSEQRGRVPTHPSA
eukprot:4892085-Prymnesium_polylepis.1